MPNLTLQQQQEEERREQERIINSRFFNKQKWRYRRVDKPWENEDEAESLPGLATAETFSKLLKPGVYTREDPPSAYDFRLTESGYVTPLMKQSLLSKMWRGEGVVGESEWEKMYTEVIEFIMIDKGCKSIVIDWPSKEAVSEKYIDKLMKLASDKKLVAEFGPQVEAYLDKHPALRRKYAKMQLEQRTAQAATFEKPEYVSVKRNANYKIHKKTIAAQEKLSGSDVEKKQQFEQRLAASDRDVTLALERAAIEIDQRLSHAEIATKEVAGHIAGLVPATQAVFVRENGAVWNDLLNTVVTEQADLQTRVTLAQEKMTAQKAVIEAAAAADRTPAQTAQLAQLQRTEEKLQHLAERVTVLKSGNDNTAGCVALQQKVDELRGAPSSRPTHTGRIGSST